MAGNVPLGFLKSRHAQVLTVVLLAQFAGLFAISRREVIPAAQPLESFPATLGSWVVVQDAAVGKDVESVLRADDILSRVYADRAQNRAAALFVAYFKSQRTGQTPHSPKNCLPGAGWAPSESQIIPVAIPGLAEPVYVNHYVVAKGDEKDVVLYWYQSRQRVVASEYRAKLYLVADAVRYNRTDTALVRIVVPVFQNDSAAATRTATDFMRAFFTQLRNFLPS